MQRLHLLGTIDLRDEAGEEIKAVLTQPKRVALLAYLAVARPGGHYRRDSLLALFWPELDEERARNALSKGIHFLRRFLGQDAILTRTTDEVAVDPRLVWSDVGAFRRAVAEERVDDALALYRGDLLAAFHLSEAAGFERWLEGERAALRALAAKAAKTMAERLLAQRQITGAVEHARKAVELSGHDERMLRRLLVLLESVGNRAAAVATYESFAQHLQQDFATVPAPETQALIARIRAAHSPDPGMRTPGQEHDSDPFDQLAAALSDRYLLERELGSGGSATVYLAKDLKLQRQVAIKVLRPSVAASVGTSRFLHEILIAAGLNHPHIVPLLDSGEAGGFVFYVMPWLSGDSVRERLIREGRLPMGESVRLAREVADALAYAHAHNVIHRDIKPENILLESGHAVVADFGIARAIGTAAVPRPGVPPAGSGTPAYVSPEQSVGAEPGDGRGDIYSLGCVLFEMLTGRPPFAGSSLAELVAQHKSATPPEITALRPGLPRSLKTTIERALAKDPSDRFPSALAFRGALGITSSHSWISFGAAALAILTSVGLAASLLFRTSRTATLLGLSRITFGPEWATYPTISGDGERVAYQVRGPNGSRILIRGFHGGPPDTLNTALPGTHRYPAFSPTGARLLFHSPVGLAVQAVGSTQAQLLAADGETAAWSPDGESVVYATDSTLVRFDIATGTRTVLARGLRPGTPAWSPDGRYIAFALGTVGLHWEGNLSAGALHVVPAQGGARWEISSGGLNTSPVWLPGGRRLLFVSDRDGGRDIYQLNITATGRAQGAPIRLTTGSNVERLAVSSDGRRLAWSVYSESSNVWALRMMPGIPVPMSHAWQVTTGNRVIENFDISPDRLWLYFDSDQRGVSSIWKAALAGGNEIQLTFGGEGDFGPKVSPDGRTLVFHAIRHGQRDIFSVPAEGGRPVRITTSPQQDMNVHWAPDGRRIVWDESSNLDTLLWQSALSPDGQWSPPIPLWLGVGRRVLSPAWSPDGERIAFHGQDGIQTLSIRDNRLRTVHPTLSGEFVDWSDDGRTIYFATPGVGGRFEIRAVDAEGGPARLVAFADDPWRQGHRFGLAVTGDTLYFGLTGRVGEIRTASLTF